LGLQLGCARAAALLLGHGCTTAAACPAGGEFCAIAALNYSMAGAWGWDDRRCDEMHIFMCRLMRGFRV
jgi:hypothetical protein